MSAIAKMATVALAYVLAGKLGLLLAVPPGYATAVWPPSGIALGALLILGRRYWLAVGLGSFLTNIGTVTEASGALDVAAALLPPACIGLGAALQAFMGVTLIRRFLGWPLELGREREIFFFFMLAGPIASLINPTLSVATLWSVGNMPTSALAYNWWTWWVGDTIGAIIFTPLVLIWFGGERWRTRRVAVTVPLAATFAAAVLVFVYTSRLEWARLEQRFQEDADEMTSTIERRLDLNVELLRAVGGLFTASHDVEADEFRRFAAVMLTQRADMQAVEWAPRVTAAQRRPFEEGLGHLQPEQSFIFERSAGGRIRAPEREEYFPLQFVEPLHLNGGVRGFDIASEANRLRTLQNARDTGRIAATPPLDLIQSDGISDGFLMALPVFTPGLADDSTPPQRQAALRGFALAAIRAPQLVNLAIGERPVAHRLWLRIYDTAAGRPLYRSPEKTEETERTAAAGQLGLQTLTKLSVADRTWTLEFKPTLDYLAGHNTLIAWMVLAGGLVFAALVGAGALVVTGRTATVEALVHARTAELARTNERLEKADRIKSEFISTVSHELRTPITSIRGSLGLLTAGAAGALPEKAVPLVDIANRNTTRLAMLIDDILDVEKLDSGQLSLDLQVHSLPALVEQAVDANRHYAQSRNIGFRLSRPLPHSQVRVDAHRLLQVLANLLSNAAKFSPEGSDVEIGIETDGSRARVSVKDRGPGIPLAFQSRIFQRFSQADASDSRSKSGTGLGLAISKALIERMQGRIGYETLEGQGTTFFIELPLASSEPSV